jgi:hypothetical protein
VSSSLGLSSWVADLEARSRPWIDYLLLAAPSLSTPLLFWATNLVGVGHPLRLISVGLVTWALAATCLALLTRFGCSRTPSLVGVWTATYLYTRGGGVPDSYGYPLAMALAGSALAIGIYLLSRVEAPRLRLLTLLASGLLVLEIGIALYATWTSMGVDRSLPAPAEYDLELESTPDIVLVVADAYVGVDALQRYFDVEYQPDGALQEHGFWLPELAFSAYASTNAALPAILDMHYPIEGGPGINPATRQQLYDRIGGNNRFVDVLKNNGYQVTMIESGWSGSICGSAVDQCVPSPFVDESVYKLVERSWLGPFVWRKFGYAFNIGASGTMAWLDENIENITNNSTPDFVMAHLEIPHPPMFLDGRCDLVVSEDRNGVLLRRPGVDIDVRKAAYLEQAKCVDRFMADLSERIGSDVVLILTGDHGSDSHLQMDTNPIDWTDDAIRERFNVMFAFRGPEVCRPSEPVLLTMVLQDLLQCLSGESLQPLPARMFQYANVEFNGQLSPVIEVDPELVAELVGYDTE